MKEKIINFWGFVLDLLFPPVCLVCRRRITKTFSQSEARGASGHGSEIRQLADEESERRKPAKILAGDLSGSLEKKFSLICSSCSQKIQINTTAFCPVCYRRLPENKKTCHLDASFILAAAGSYNDEVLNQLITLLKYQKIKTASIPLGEILREYFRNLELEVRNFVVVPIPLHWQREKQRGFNQTHLIVNELVKNINLPVMKNVLKRIRNTPSQVELKEKEKREINVRGCFRVEKPELLFQKNVIILDDVFTSGATMREAVEIIKKAGAKKIIGLVVAKTN